VPSDPLPEPPLPETPRNGPSGSAFAWTGAALFGLSLGWFLFSYFVRFPRLAAGASSPIGAALWDVALFAAFAAHHSAFARDRLRVAVERTWPGRERSVFVWTASVLLILVCAGWQPVAGTAWTLQGPASWLLYGARAAGLWLTLRAVALIDVWELAGTSPARHQPGERGDSNTFTRRGPYGWVRHPIYSGWFLIVFSLPVMTMTQLVFAVVSSAYLLVGIVFEERSLVRAAPEAYGQYRAQVRWKIVPGLY
jgi:protein-S-isoprenylcysteine O-methyltransferase Ste14